jgi:hypothetical protein
VILDGLVIRIYDNAGILANERARAISRADSILSRADIDVEWIDCPASTHGRPSSLCTLPPAPSELIVRLMNAPEGGSGPGLQTLGYSLIDTTTGTGTLATLYIDRATRLASGARIDRATVVGRAIAHEIGHLILGTNEHSGAGIMREHWTVKQLASGKARDWLFLPSQRDQMRQARLLSGSGGSNASVGRRGKAAGG